VTVVVSCPNPPVRKEGWGNEACSFGEGEVVMPAQTPYRPGERIFICLLLAFGIFVLITALMIPNLENLSSSGVFPIFVGSILILSMVHVLWHNRKRYAASTLPEEWKRVPAFVLPIAVVGYAGILLLYILTTAPLHFIPSSFAFLVISFIFLRGASPLRSVIIGVGTLAGIYILFQTVFKVILW
jgi:putative tricarboxylic transport membrane protein